ncbi:hypothetical protein ACFQ1E_06735 [Sphingomonas canadensis]|uniref:Uncharacterized protein n=2 Tax=Sphingomonas canadensis TaxID=1219257 RepID=A0ABW3H8N8_9SPHN
MIRRILSFAAAAALLLAPQSATAGWKAIAQGKPIAVAKTGLTVTAPSGVWNRWSLRPSKKSELWTKDGLALNELAFYSGVTSGEPIFREVDKKNSPLPKFNSKMLAPDVVALFEASNRIALKTSLFSVDSVEPAQFVGQPGVRFTFTYSVQNNDLVRKGEARAAVLRGQLYMITFIAPSIYYFDNGIADARAIMDSAVLLPVAAK